MIVVLASGSGTNFAALANAFPKKVTELICNVANAPVLEKAKQQNIKATLIAHKDYSTRIEHDLAVVDYISKLQNIRLIVLAGYMRILSPNFFSAYNLLENKPLIINLHPAPLDKYKGAHAYEYALENKFSKWGISIHQVTAELDSGPLISFQEFDILPNENLENLKLRARDIEHKLFNKHSIKIIATGDLICLVKIMKKAGVSIAAGEKLVDMIKKINPSIGGFAGLYPLDSERSLVACTDGVGTKLELGIQAEKYEALGQDLVAMSVNDLIVCGGRPLFFLDYFATSKLDVAVAHRVIKGIVNACQESYCLLLGGETAEMPGFYGDNKFDLAGFAVGEVKNSEIIDGKNIIEGDIIIGLPSSGFHSNGYSLIRKIMKDNSVSLNTPFENKTIGEYLCEPTKLYVKDILNLKSKVTIKGMAHITGGGLTNIARVLPCGLFYDIDKSKIPVQPIMKHFQNLGKISEDEAFTVWNMGMGFCVVVDKDDINKVTELIPNAFVAGKIVKLEEK